MSRPIPSSRREFLRLSIGVPGAAVLGVASERTARAQMLRPTPSCADEPDPTPRQTAGPYFLPNSPERRSLLEPGLRGTTIVMTGRVVFTDCRPVRRALLDVWHADDQGEYDTTGYRLRGHQFTDDDGRYRFETIVPGIYPGRTRHVHVKVQAPGQPVLTTQLYFPREPGNRRDRIFHPDLVMTLEDGGGARQGRFDFVLRPGAR